MIAFKVTLEQKPNGHVFIEASTPASSDATDTEAKLGEKLKTVLKAFINEHRIHGTEVWDSERRRN